MQIVTIQPDLRHHTAHLNALLWTCPHDHAPLRMADAGEREYLNGRLAVATASEPGLYSCGLHDWRLSEGRTWAEVGALIVKVA